MVDAWPALLSPLGRSPDETAAYFGFTHDRSSLPMAATEGQSHLVRYANPAFGRLVGSAVEAILGRPLAEVLPAVGGRDEAGVLDRVYRSGFSESAGTSPNAPADAPRAPNVALLSAILGGDGRPVGLLVQMTEATAESLAPEWDANTSAELRHVNQQLLLAGLRAHEQIEVQAALNRALHQVGEERDRRLLAEQQAREVAEGALQVHDQLLSIAAHELRTPVTGIRVQAQVALRALARSELDEHRSGRWLQTILAAADRLTVLIGDVMDVSRMRSGHLALHPTRLDFAALVRTVGLRYAETVDDAHQVRTDVPAGPLIVQGDAVRLEQVLDNLVGNALKYSPDGGEILLRLRQTEAGVELTVADSGMGIAAGELELVFAPFRRAASVSARSIPGMGLGLHICREIVEAHGGRMWAESAGEGLGTTLTVQLPALDPPEGEGVGSPSTLRA